MAQTEAPQYDTMALLVLLERVRTMPKKRHMKQIHERARRYLGEK